MDGRDPANSPGGPDDGPAGPDVLHVPVLLEESLGFLDLDGLDARGGGVVVDCTLGLGGHSEAILERSRNVRVLGVDRDREALRRASDRLRPFGARFEPVHAEYSDLDRIVAEQCGQPVDGVFADLGVSSMQLDRAERGFSFMRDGPLDMRMDQSRGETAADVVRTYSEAALEKLLRQYGEERQARRIARAIVERREEEPIETTAALRETVASASRAPRRRPRSGRRIDPATRTFQALRIEVNQELQGLETMLDSAMRQLDTDGRLVVILYHSLEDRIAKSALRAAARGEVDEVTGSARVETRLIELLTKKPVRPSEAEVEANPRSRSARLRAARRL